MDLFTLFNLLAAAAAGASIGSHLLLSLLYVPLFKQAHNFLQSLITLRRLYRLNTVLCLFAGTCAALLNNRSAAFMLAILAVSYVFTHTHLLKALLANCDTEYVIRKASAFRSVRNLQNMVHLLQISGAGYAIYLLALTEPAV
jgi:hypothetical protein